MREILLPRLELMALAAWQPGAAASRLQRTQSCQLGSAASYGPAIKFDSHAFSSARPPPAHAAPGLAGAGRQPVGQSQLLGHANVAKSENVKMSNWQLVSWGIACKRFGWANKKPTSNDKWTLGHL